MNGNRSKRTLRAAKSFGAWIVPVVVFLLLAASTPTWANVYASGLSKTADFTFSYILNENADTGVRIEVWKVGGTMVYSEDLGPQTAGGQSWTWNGNGAQPGQNYKVRVIPSDPGYTGWTQIVADSTVNNFFLPMGVSVNKSQDSAKFGKIYISEAQAGLTTTPPTNSRTTQDGIYMLNADGTDAGFATGGKDWVAAGNSSPFKSTIGPDGHLYVADFSNDLAWEFSEDMSSVTQLIDASNKTGSGTTAQWVESILVEGTQAAGNRKIYLVDSNYTDTARKGLIQYNLGSASAAATGDTGTQAIGPTYFTYYPRDVARDSAGNWYMNNYRATAGQAGPIVKFDGSLPWPINTAMWTASSTYTYSYGIDIFEPKGWAAYAHYNTGFVYIFNMADGSYVGGFDAGTRLRDIAFDAAGNVITVDTSLEWARIWSPGDNANSFTTESYFTFDVVPEPSSLLALLVGLPGLLVLRRRKH
jgi:hypothetical protein